MVGDPWAKQAMVRLKQQVKRPARPPRPPRPRRLPLLSFGLLLLFGVLAMHGMQVSRDPSEMTGLPLASAVAVHDAAPSQSMALHHAPGTDQPSDHHQDHPGGQVCLAILVMLFLIGLVIARFRRAALAAVARALAGTHVPPVGRPPSRPSLHRLSVLRL
jgi:Family of unknown function (DUF6153)